MGRGWGWRLWIAVLRLDILRIIIRGGAWCLVLVSVLGHATLRVWVKAVEVLCSRCCGYLFQLPFLMQFAVPPEALRVTKLFSTDVTFVILLSRVDSLMFAEVKSLSKILSTNCAVMWLFSGMDAVMSSQGLTTCKSLTTNAAEVGAWETTGSHSGCVLPTFGGLSTRHRIFLSSGFAGAFWFSRRILWVAAHCLLAPHTSEILIHARRC